MKRAIRRTERRRALLTGKSPFSSHGQASMSTSSDMPRWYQSRQGGSTPTRLARGGGRPPGPAGIAPALAAPTSGRDGRGSHLLHGLELDADLHLVADEHATRLEGRVPQQPELAAI